MASSGRWRCTGARSGVFLPTQNPKPYSISQSSAIMELSAARHPRCRQRAGGPVVPWGQPEGSGMGGYVRSPPNFVHCACTQLLPNTRWNRYFPTSLTSLAGFGATNSARAVAKTLPPGPSAGGAKQRSRGAELQLLLFLLPHELQATCMPHERAPHKVGR